MGKTNTRLLFVTSFYPPLIGGGASRIQDFARLLQQIGFDTTVLTFLPAQKLRRFRPSVDQQVNVIRFPTLGSKGFKHPIDQIFTSLIGTFVILLFRRPQHVIVSVPPGEPCIGSYMAARIFGKRLIVDIRDEWEDAVLKRTKRAATKILYRFYKALFTAIYQRSLFATTVSPTLVKRIKERGVKETLLLPNGADVKLFHPKSTGECAMVREALGMSEQDFIFVYAGVVGWYYRIDIIIKALHKLVKEQGASDLKLLVLGSGDRAKEYETLAKQFELSDRVRFLGEKPRNQVAQILPCCDVGVIPFDDDPIWMSAYTTKLFEYSASGLPTIVSVVKESDLEKVVVENRIGFYAEPMQIDEMAEAMLRAYNNKKRLKQIGLNARKLAIEKFNRKTTVQKLAELLRARS